MWRPCRQSVDSGRSPQLTHRTSRRHRRRLPRPRPPANTPGRRSLTPYPQWAGSGEGRISAGEPKVGAPPWDVMEPVLETVQYPPCGVAPPSDSHRRRPELPQPPYLPQSRDVPTTPDEMINARTPTAATERATCRPALRPLRLVGIVEIYACVPSGLEGGPLGMNCCRHQKCTQLRESDHPGSRSYKRRKVCWAPQAG